MEHKGAKKFQQEIDRITNEDAKVFVHNAIVSAPESFWKDDELVTYTRKVFKVVEHLLDLDHVQGTIRDIILSATLLCDIAVNELKEPYKSLHPLAAKTYLQPVIDDLNKHQWKGLIRIIEAHEGSDSPSDQLIPQPGSPEHLVALAHALVKAKDIEVKLDK